MLVSLYNLIEALGIGLLFSSVNIPVTSKVSLYINVGTSIVKLVEYLDKTVIDTLFEEPSLLFIPLSILA